MGSGWIRISQTVTLLKLSGMSRDEFMRGVRAAGRIVESMREMREMV